VARWRDRLRIGAPRPLDLWVVLYDSQLDQPVQPYLDVCDVTTFWTWKAEALNRLEENFARVESMTPGKRRLIGCYMFDYGTKHPMPVALMQKQCELGLRWLRAGRLDGMIFCSNCCADLGLDRGVDARVDRPGGRRKDRRQVSLEKWNRIRCVGVWASEP